MAGPGGNNICIDRSTYEAEIAYYIEQLMAGRFVRMMQFHIIEYAFFDDIDIRLIE